MSEQTLINAGQSLSEYEEHCWMQAQHSPEKQAWQHNILQLGEHTDRSLLVMAAQQLINETPMLNVRYHFSDDGELSRQAVAGWHPCLQFEQCLDSALDAHLDIRRQAAWDSSTQPPFSASLIQTGVRSLFALFLHPVLQQQADTTTLIARLAERYQQLHPHQQQPDWQSYGQPPETNHANVISVQILDAFRQALNAPAMQAGDNFFDFGGHSLLATRIIGKLQEEHDIQLRFNDFFEAASANDLATRASHSDPRARQTRDDLLDSTTDIAPLALAQASLWRAYVALDYSNVINLPFALQFRDEIDENCFRQAFEDLMLRHGSLRTLFREQDGEIYQHVIPTTELNQYRWFWFSHESQGVTLADEAGYRFDLGCELAIRVRFLRPQAGSPPQLSLLIQHLIIDEWSVNVMMEELAHAYLARAAGHAPYWQATPRSLNEFARQQQREGLNHQHLAYWVDKLAGPRHPVHLRPISGAAANPQTDALQAGWLAWQPVDGTLAMLNQFAREHDASLFSVIYTTIAVVLHKQASVPDLLIGTSASGRTDPVFFDTLGYFTAMVAHRVHFDAAQSFGQLLRAVSREINDSMAYADIPLESIQQGLGMQPEDGMLFDVYIQVHANNALNGYLSTPDGQRIRYRQIDPDKKASIFGLWFEIMEDIHDGDRTLRLVTTYNRQRYQRAQIEALCAGINALFTLVRQGQASQQRIGELVL